MGIFGKSKGDAPKGRKPDFSSVRAGSSSAPTQPMEQAAESYTVQRGDSLWKIAERYYGDGNQWRRIYDANREQIKDPDVIHPGQTFKIPPAPGKGGET